MATLINTGRNIEVQTRTLSATDDTQISFVNPCNAVFIKARTAVDIQIRSSRGNPSYFTLASGNTLNINLSGYTVASVTQPTNIWIRSVSATPVVEILGTYGG